MSVMTLLRDKVCKESGVMNSAPARVRMAWTAWPCFTNCDAKSAAL